MNTPMHYLPAALTTMRVCLAPLLLGLAMTTPQPALFGLILTAALLSDIFDGVIARRLGVATAALRYYDSLADTVFYLAVLAAIVYLHADMLWARIGPLTGLLILEFARYIYERRKFGRMAAYHSWLAKSWGLLLFAGCFFILAVSGDSRLVDLALYAGLMANIEGFAISLISRERRTDVATLWHAWRIERQIRKARRAAGLWYMPGLSCESVSRSRAPW